MNEDIILKEDQKKWHGTLSAYLIGLFLSLFFTLSAYYIISENLIEKPALYYAVFSCAILQLIAQFIFFLHLGKESKPFWKAQVLGFAVLTAIILIFGSIWIMHSLSSRVMPQNWHTDMFPKEKSLGKLNE